MSWSSGRPSISAAARSERRLGALAVAAVVLGEAEQRGGQRLEPAVGQPHGVLGRPRGPLVHRLEVAVVEGVGGQLGVQGRGRRAVLVLEGVERVEQPRVGGVVAAEQVLARRAGGDQPHAQVGQLDQRERVHERLQRALQPPGGGQRARQRDEQREAPPRVAGHGDRGVGDRRAEQAQRGLEPAGGDGGRPCRDLVAGLLEHRGGGLVAGAGGALDVVGAGGQRGRAVGERLGGAGVRLQPPRLARPVVHGAAHQRMPEAVAPGDIGRPGDVGRQQGVDRGQGLALVEPGGGGREIEVERLAGHGGAPAEPAGGLAQARDLLAERGGHGGRDADRVRLGVRRGGRRGSPGQLLEVERVAAALAVEQRERALAEQGVGLGLRERTEADLGDHPVAARGLQRREQRVGHLAGAEGERDQDRRHRRAAQQVGDQLERGVVGPLHVVEHQHDRVTHGHPLQEGPHRAVGVEALVLQTARPGRRRRTGARARARRRGRRSGLPGGARRGSRRGRRARRSRERREARVPALRRGPRTPDGGAPAPVRRARRAAASCRSPARR